MLCMGGAVKCMSWEGWAGKSAGSGTGHASVALALAQVLTASLTLLKAPQGPDLILLQLLPSQI
jgi:hypothetical protein